MTRNISTVKHWLLVGLLAGFSGPAQARWMELKEAGSVVEKFIIDLNINKDGTWQQTVEYAVRVQAEDAKANVSLFNIEYNASTEEVEILEAYTQNGKEKFKVEKSAIEDRDKGESRAYDAVKLRSLVFPQVQIGSVVNVRYQMKGTKPPIKDRWSTVLTFSPGTFTKEYWVRVNSERPLYFEVSDPRELIRVKAKDPRHLVISNRKLMPGWVHAEKDAFFHPSGFTRVVVSTEKSWLPFYKELNTDYEAVVSAEVPKKLRPWLKEAAQKKSPPEQILFLLEKMSREFRYFGDWRRHNGGFVPRTLSEIESSRYGDCKDLSSLLTAMLRALKIDAEVALVRRGDNPWGEEPDYTLPALGYFNHAIVRANDGKNTYWLDPTNAVGSLKPLSDISGRMAWRLRSQVKDRLPANSAKDFIYDHEYEYTIQSASQTSVKVSASLKNLASQNLANDLLLSSRSDVLSDTLEYYSEGNEVKSFRYLKEPDSSRQLKDIDLALEYKAESVTFDAGKAAFFVIPDGFLGGPFYETENRESDLRLGRTPYVFESRRRLKGSRLAQDNPGVCHIESEWLNLDRTVSSDGNDVVIKQVIDLKRAYVTKAEIRSQGFRKLQEQARSCFYRSGVLVEQVKGPLSMRDQ